MVVTQHRVTLSDNEQAIVGMVKAVHGIKSVEGSIKHIISRYGELEEYSEFLNRKRRLN